MHTGLFTAMAHSCSSNSEEDHVILLGALAVLQQIDDEEKKQKQKQKTKKMVDWMAHGLRGASSAAHFML